MTHFGWHIDAIKRGYLEFLSNEGSSPVWLSISDKLLLGDFDEMDIMVKRDTQYGNQWQLVMQECNADYAARDYEVTVKGDYPGYS